MYYEGIAGLANYNQALIPFSSSENISDKIGWDNEESARARYCLKAGGNWIGNTYNNPSTPHGTCQMAPAAVAAPPPTINVNPTIQTQINPQISPILTQQDQPTGSPVNAGTSQKAGVESSGQDNTAYLQYIAQLNAENQKQQKEFYERLLSQQSAQQMPALPAISYPAPTDTPITNLPSMEEINKALTGEGGAAPNIPQLPAVAQTSNKTMYIVLGVGILGLIVIMSMKKRGKSNAN